jgi:hypothetical protein
LQRCPRRTRRAIFFARSNYQALSFHFFVDLEPSIEERARSHVLGWKPEWFIGLVDLIDGSGQIQHFRRDVCR